MTHLTLLIVTVLQPGFIFFSFFSTHLVKVCLVDCL